MVYFLVLLMVSQQTLFRGTAFTIGSLMVLISFFSLSGYRPTASLHDAFSQSAQNMTTQSLYDIDISSSDTTLSINTLRNFPGGSSFRIDMLYDSSTIDHNICTSSFPFTYTNSGQKLSFIVTSTSPLQLDSHLLQCNISLLDTSSGPLVDSIMWYKDEIMSPLSLRKQINGL